MYYFGSLKNYPTAFLCCSIQSRYFSIVDKLNKLDKLENLNLRRDRLMKKGEYQNKQFSLYKLGSQLVSRFNEPLPDLINSYNYLHGFGF